MAFDKIVGVDGTTYQFPSVVRQRIADNIEAAGSVENLAVIDALGPALATKSDTTHNHTLASLTSNGIDELGDVEIGVVGGNGIALADKHTLQYESSTSKWRNKVASGGVTVSDSRPTTPIPGDAWFDSNDGTLYVYYTDGDTAQWVQVQANSALEGTILARLGAVESRTTALEPASPLLVSSASERDTKIPSPVQGNSVFRDDLALTETYLAAKGSAPAGWVSEYGSGLVPIRPTSVVISGGTASTNSLGFVTYSGCSDISLNGVFTAAYKKYLINFQVTDSATNAPLMRLSSGGTANITGNYQEQFLNNVDATNSASRNYNLTRLSLNSTGASRTTVGQLILTSPAESVWTVHELRSVARNNETSFSTIYQIFACGGFAGTTQFDGFMFLPNGASTLSGNIQVLGYND